MDEWVAEWTDGQMDGWMVDGLIDGWICVWREAPLGSGEGAEIYDEDGWKLVGVH